VRQESSRLLELESAIRRWRSAISRPLMRAWGGARRFGHWWRAHASRTNQWPRAISMRHVMCARCSVAPMRSVARPLARAASWRGS